MGHCTGERCLKAFTSLVEFDLGGLGLIEGRPQPDRFANHFIAFCAFNLKGHRELRNEPGQIGLALTRLSVLTDALGNL